MSFILNVPINAVSFGQVSTLLAREFYLKNKDFILFPIGNGLDVGTQEADEGFFNYLKNQTDNFLRFKRSCACTTLKTRGLQHPEQWQPAPDDNKTNR